MPASASSGHRAAFVLALVGLFAFRLIYGLSMPFWFEDERQVYLIGLRSFATGTWPYFGADVVWTGGRVPGALLGWAIRGPLEFWPIPEAPVVLLNVISAVALSLLAWYLGRRIPDVPRWLVWFGLFTLPWTLNFSTHVVNPSYVLAASIVFFVGFLETSPAFTRGIVPLWGASAMMGAGLLSVVQLHMSWVLLVPFVVYATGAVIVDGGAAFGLTRTAALLRTAPAFLAGGVVPGALLLPTVMRHGWDFGTGAAFLPHWQSPFEFVTTAARILSFTSYEINRFIGMSTAERVLLVWRNPWIAVPLVPVVVAGLVQPLWMGVAAFRRSAAPNPDWVRIRWLLAGTGVLITVSYYFSVRGPQAHSFYVVFPVSVVFALTCWSERARANGGRLPRLERAAAVVIAASIALHLGLAFDRLQRLSLYADRDLVARAIAVKEAGLLGEPRQGAITSSPSDLEVVDMKWLPVVGRISRFDLSIRNQGEDAAWLDVRLAANYLDASGTQIATRDLVIKQIIQPGQTRRFTDLADDFVPDGAATATLKIISAERVIPRR